MHRLRDRTKARCQPPLAPRELLMHLGTEVHLLGPEEMPVLPVSRLVLERRGTAAFLQQVKLLPAVVESPRALPVRGARRALPA